MKKYFKFIYHSQQPTLPALADSEYNAKLQTNPRRTPCRAPTAFFIILILTLVLAIYLPPAISAPTLPQFPFHNSGPYIVDNLGRVVMFHGVNMVNKFPPYAPSDVGFGEVDAKLISDAGWNVVRLGVLHSGVEPSPGEYDESYLERIAQTVRLLGSFGIFSLLDFHQDLYGPVFSGDGLPPWMTLTDGLPLQPSHGFPNDYFELPALQRAFDNFWKNSLGPGGVGLQDRFAAAWRQVAKRFAAEPWVLGYDLFNEPFPGSRWQSCTPVAGCAEFDPVLGAFMTKVARAIESVDARHMIFYEPPILFGFGIPANLPSPGGKRVGFSFHDYWPKDFSLPMRNALSHSKKTGAALFMTEFGASVHPGPVVQVAELADAHLLGWIYWAYANKTPFKIVSPGLPPTPEEQGVVLDLAKPRIGANLNGAILQALTRPYPVAIAGTPLSYGYDPLAKRFQLSYRKAGVDSGLRSRQTVVVLPASLYPQGYRVEVSGAKVSSAPGAKFLEINAQGENDTVTLSVAPPREGHTTFFPSPR